MGKAFPDTRKQKPYDANPANLNPLPPAKSATRYIEFMGEAESVLNKAQAYFERGEYRWVAEVLNQLIFAEPDNKKAKELLAMTYDQLGYLRSLVPGEISI